MLMPHPPCTAAASLQLGLPEDTMLALDQFLIGSSRTRSSDSLVTDSASGATAFSCGIKTYNAAIGGTRPRRPRRTAASGLAITDDKVARFRKSHRRPGTQSTLMKSLAAPSWRRHTGKACSRPLSRHAVSRTRRQRRSTPPSWTATLNATLPSSKSASASWACTCLARRGLVFPVGVRGKRTAASR